MLDRRRFFRALVAASVWGVTTRYVVARGPKIVRAGAGSCGELRFIPACDEVGGAFDANRRSVVFVQGFKPFSKCVHFELGVAARQGSFGGSDVNVWEWDWNQATMASLRPAVNVVNAQGQGESLATALVAAGLTPSGTELVGHSLGCIVVAAAARHWSETTGERVAVVTLLEPLRGNHGTIFDDERVADYADRVENRWSPGLSGFGAPASRAGVSDIRTPGRTPVRGLVLPHRMNHVDALRQFFE